MKLRKLEIIVIIMLLILSMPDRSFGGNNLTIQDTSSFPGDTIALSLTAENSEQFTAFQCDIRYPGLISCLIDSVVLGPRATDHVLSKNLVNDTILRLIAYSPNQSFFTGSSGEIAKIVFSIDASANFPISLQLANGIMANGDGDNILTGLNNGNIYGGDNQSCTLNSGYQLISSSIVPDSANLLALSSEFQESLDFIRNNSGDMLQKIGPEWVNNIGDWNTVEGYLFKMNAEDELVIEGIGIDPQTPIDLAVGYQFVSYLPENPLNAQEAVTGVLENLEFIRNSEGDMLRKIGSVWVNNIGDMQPGEGYLFKMIQDDQLIYNTGDL